MKLAYIMSRFPTVTETFVLLEMSELRRRRTCPEIYPLIWQRLPVVHPEAQDLMPHVHRAWFVSPRVVWANVRSLVAHPLRYAAVIWELASGMFGSWRLFLKTLIVFPKSVWMTLDMQRRGIEHVHAHFSTLPAAAALVARRLADIPFTFTAHGSDIHVDQRMLDRKIEASAGAVMVSEYNRRFVLERCGTSLADKLSVIHCGIRPDDYEACRSQQGGEDRPFTVACVAALKEVKGHEYLIEACRILRDRGVDFVCRLAGDGPLRRRIEEQIGRHGLEGRVLLHGALARDEVSELLKQADAAALTSVPTARGRREGIPVALMEAMAAGLPVVASRISGVPELVEHERNGLLVPPRESEAIADALQRLSDDPELGRRLGLAARAKVREEFDIEQTVDRLLELWQGIRNRA